MAQFTCLSWKMTISTKLCYRIILIVFIIYVVIIFIIGTKSSSFKDTENVNIQIKSINNDCKENYINSNVFNVILLIWHRIPKTGGTNFLQLLEKWTQFKNIQFHFAAYNDEMLYEQHKNPLEIWSLDFPTQSQNLLYLENREIDYYLMHIIRLKNIFDQIIYQ